MRPVRTISNTSGFTLIEVLIAIAIFGIGIMAMGALQTASLKETGNIARKTQALTLLEDQVESLKRQPFYQDVAAQTFPADLTVGAHNRVTPDGRFTINWNVVDDQPIGQQPETVLPGVPVGMYTVSKTITASVNQTLGGNLLARVEFVKVWYASGFP